MEDEGWDPVQWTRSARDNLTGVTNAYVIRDIPKHLTIPPTERQNLHLYTATTIPPIREQIVSTRLMLRRYAAGQLQPVLLTSVELYERG